MMSQKISDNLLGEVSRFVEANMGLSFPQEKWRDLARGLRSLTAQFGCADEAALARQVISSPLSKRQIEILASGLTIGETYFFREKCAFAAFEQLVLSEFSRPRPGADRTLRIWSAGCASGEEPYTIAMLLTMLLPDLRDWSITLLATDINPLFLEKAEKGIYTKWSFREMPKQIISRFFTKTGDNYTIHPEIKTMVTFSRHNLMQDDYPSLLNNTNAMDVIFCRNTLMYFAPAAIKRVTRNFHRCLTDGGKLIVSQTELNDEYFHGFEKTSHCGAIFFRKSEGTVNKMTSIPPDFLPPLQGGGWGRYGVDGDISDVSPSCKKHPHPPPGPPSEEGGTKSFNLPFMPQKALARKENNAETLSLLARACANHGQLDEALRHIEEAIRAEKMNAGRHYLQAAILIEKGQKEEAMQALKRAVYLDADFALAYFAMGNLAHGSGKMADAERYFNHALLLLRRHDEEEILPESEGITAGRLVDLIKSMQWRKQERR